MPVGSGGGPVYTKRSTDRGIHITRRHGEFDFEGYGIQPIHSAALQKQGSFHGLGQILSVGTNLVQKERPGAPPNSNVEYYSIKAIKRTYRGMMLLGSWIFLVIPICLLYRSNNNVFKLVTVVAFLVTFSISVAVLTKAKDWEMLASTAAYVVPKRFNTYAELTLQNRYAAVLVVFLQIEST